VPVPTHVAIIMDGNGRWAQKRLLPHIAGHKKGVDVVPRIVEHAAMRGVHFITLYAFSWENWTRPKTEVAYLMDLFKSAFAKELQRMLVKGVRIRFIGRRERLSPELIEQMDAIEKATCNCTTITVVVALNYGGRAEIADAVKAMVVKGVPADEITEDTIGDYLYASDIPDPDLIIRTSGEQRLSNFLIWQSAYSEIYITDILWPDFDETAFDAAMEWFETRQRRFGGRP